MLFHIRKQLRKRGGNQFYRDRSIRKTETLCGAPVTDVDLPFNGKIAGLPGFECCQDCLTIKKEKYDT